MPRPCCPFTYRPVKRPFPQLALVVLLILIGSIAHGQTTPTDRLSRFKAIFLYNFIQFVRWSEADTARTFTISLLGTTSIEEPLRKIADKRTAAGRKLEIKRLQNLDDLGSPHIIFLPAAQIHQASAVLKRIEGTNILAIGDAPGLGQKGMPINFAQVGENLKFEINQSALARAGLGASSQLLKLAIPVGEAQTP